MNLEAIIDAVANKADELLTGVTTMTEARPVLRDYLKVKFPQLGATDSPRVVAGILAILDEEDFFNPGANGDS